MLFATLNQQARCYLQVKLCAPCLSASALYVPWCEKALYKYSSFPFLSFNSGRWKLARTGDGDAAVGGDADGGHVIGVSDQLMLDVAPVEVPDEQASVVRPGHDRPAAAGDDDAADDVLVFDEHLAPRTRPQSSFDASTETPPD